MKDHSLAESEPKIRSSSRPYSDAEDNVVFLPESVIEHELKYLENMRGDYVFPNISNGTMREAFLEQELGRASYEEIERYVNDHGEYRGDLMKNGYIQDWVEKNEPSIYEDFRDISPKWGRRNIRRLRNLAIDKCESILPLVNREELRSSYLNHETRHVRNFQSLGGGRIKIIKRKIANIANRHYDLIVDGGLREGDSQERQIFNMSKKLGVMDETLATLTGYISYKQRDPILSYYHLVKSALYFLNLTRHDASFPRKKCSLEQSIGDSASSDNYFAANVLVIMGSSVLDLSSPTLINFDSFPLTKGLSKRQIVAVLLDRCEQVINEPSVRTENADLEILCKRIEQAYIDDLRLTDALLVDNAPLEGQG